MPIVLNYPGVYIEELPSAVHTITGVATSIAAFVGWADQGPINEAALVLSFPDFTNQFGGLDSRSYLGYAVNQFFANGGQQAYIVRLAWDGTLPPAPNTNPAPYATAAATGVGFASAQIQASLGSVSAPPAVVYVGTPVLQSIAITPATLPPIPINATVQFEATGINSDGTTEVITTSVRWTSTDTAVISIASGGLATPAGPGRAILTATDLTGLVSGSIPVIVSGGLLTGITVTPSALLLVAGQTQQFAATGSYSDKTSQDLTAIATWGPLADFTSTPGLFTGKADASVTAAWVSQTSLVPGKVTVASAVLTSIAISPTNPTLQTSQTITFSATPTYSDGGNLPALTTAVWSSSSTGVATINSGTGAATAVGAGSATITVTSGSSFASTVLNVTAANLKSISVIPAATSIALGITQQLKALGVYDNGTTADLTEIATWKASSADLSVTGGVVITNSSATVGELVSVTATDLFGLCARERYGNGHARGPGNDCHYSAVCDRAEWPDPAVQGSRNL
jgi:hypothetical protein